MSFEFVVAENVPVTSGESLEDNVMTFLTQIGYLSVNYQPRTAHALSKAESVPFMLFSGCFLADRFRGWKVEELTKKLKTSPPTIYRHINKLQMIGLIDHASDWDGDGGNIYRVRFGNLSLAWKIVETNVEAVKSIYRKTVESIEDSMQKELNLKKPAEKSVADAAGKGREREKFRIRLLDTAVKAKANYDELLFGLLVNIGYLERSADEVGKVKKSIPYRLFNDCFMKRRDRFWEVDPIAVTLKTSKPTIYRHLNKLLALGMVEALPIGEKHPLRVGYRMRYGSFSKAWYFVESRIDGAMRNYRKSIDYIQKQVAEGGD